MRVDIQSRQTRCRVNGFYVLLLVTGVSITACSSTSSIRRSSNAIVNKAIEVAVELKGTPYCYSGETPDCFDCSGFVGYCLLQAGMQVPRTTGELFAFGSAVTDDDLETGDLVFFTTSGSKVSHVGLYLGDQEFIHSSTSNGVMISRLTDTYWNARFIGARRLY